MTDLQLDWSTAEVSNGKLTVSLGERPTDEWVASFERTAQLLDRGNWSHVKLKKREVSVKQIEPGDEERLRFFLESVVQEANAEQGPDENEESPEEERENEDASEETESGSEPGPDAQMTDRFRSFAGGSGDSSGDA